MDKPLSVGRSHSQLTNAMSLFTYGSDGMRAKQVRTANGKTTTTYYVDKLYELDNDGAWRAYIDDVAVLSYTPDRKHLLLFTLRDRLGSTTTMVDHNANVVSRRYFDPFGRVEDMGANHDGLYGQGMVVLEETNRNRRGFTDHEHLNEQQIIHMNGRVYDYNIGRFLSVDPLIQDPGSTQSPNPYSYIMNNPLAGTDPTGYCGSRIKGNSVGNCTTMMGDGWNAKVMSNAQKNLGSPTVTSNGGDSHTATFQLDENTTLEVDFKGSIGSDTSIVLGQTYGNNPKFIVGFNNSGKTNFDFSDPENQSGYVRVKCC